MSIRTSIRLLSKLSAARLLQDARGNVLPIMGAALIPTMAMIGGGIDFGRAYLADSKLQSAIDAGALAAVRAKQLNTHSEEQIKEIGRSYIFANFPADYMGATIEVPTVNVTETNNIINASVGANGTINTTLLRLVGIQTLAIGAVANAKAAETLPTAVEALLVLDNTGSMKGVRMTSLKTAASNFIQIIYGSRTTRTGFAVGILPYNTMVNVGRIVQKANAAMVVNRPGFTDISENNALGWKGCVFADPTIQNISDNPNVVDAGALDITDNMPGVNGTPPLEPFIYPPIYVDSFQERNNRYRVPVDRRENFYAIPTIKTALTRLHGDDICKNNSSGLPQMCNQPDSVIDFNRLPDRTKYSDARYYSHKSGRAADGSRYSLDGASPNYQCPAEAFPVSYTKTKSDLLNYIRDENEALWPGTGTFHNAAMTWAFRMLTQTTIFPRTPPSNLPVKRVVIFMTDGNFDSQDDGRDSTSGRILDTAYTSYKTYEDKLLTDTTKKDDTIVQLSRRFIKTCQQMKAQGIEIYTIAFSLDAGKAGDDTKEMFKQCATNRNTHFFSASDGAQLNNAFTTIASELIDLRLTS